MRVISVIIQPQKASKLNISLLQIHGDFSVAFLTGMSTRVHWTYQLFPQTSLPWYLICDRAALVQPISHSLYFSEDTNTVRPCRQTPFEKYAPLTIPDSACACTVSLHPTNEGSLMTSLFKLGLSTQSTQLSCTLK